MNRISRRKFLIGFGAAATAAAANGLLVEPNRVDVTRSRFSSPGSQSGPTIRVLQITDLHLQAVSGHERRIAAAVNRIRPQLILITGDSVDKKDKVSVLSEFLALVDPRPLKFATLGNWEHWSRVDLDELTGAYATAGCRLLLNETVRVEYSGADLLVTGLDDWTGGKPDLISALKDVAPNPNHIVLAHSPVYRDVMPDLRKLKDAAAQEREASGYSVSCILSGHTHGGQVALFGWAPVRPAGSGAYVAGWYREPDKIPLYVSRGLGTSIAPIRFGAPPELAVFEWRLAAA